MRIEPERIRVIPGRGPAGGDYVLYWMQASQRARYNHALEYAVAEADRRGLPVLVCFCLTGEYGEAAAGHYRFMLEGLRETAGELASRGITFLLRVASPVEGIPPLAKGAAMLVSDTGYLAIQRRWRRKVAQEAGCAVVEVESDAVVPVRTASGKEEYSAATFRPRISRQLPRFMKPTRRTGPKHGPLGTVGMESVAPGSEGSGRFFDLHNLPRAVRGALPLSGVKDERILGEAGVGGGGFPASLFRGGAGEARRRLKAFLRGGLDRYGRQSNDPLSGACSTLSPYIHFGQISTLDIALQVSRQGGPGAGDFLEQLIVRRELSLNFVHYSGEYDGFGCLPEWAQKTLFDHRRDPREYTYTLEQLEEASTHDPYWNAAQDQMRLTGHMHGYMRMYWGKKIIEWTVHPEEAFDRALYLNNRYELDGRDPNGYTGVAWCFGKHDRPWMERPVFGKTRYMNAAGLRRKFDADAWVASVEALKGTSA